MTERLLNQATRFYVVQRGDTLSQIGEKTGVAWGLIAQLNELRDPDVIRPGQMLQLPDTLSTTVPDQQ